MPSKNSCVSLEIFFILWIRSGQLGRSKKLFSTITKTRIFKLYKDLRKCRIGRSDFDDRYVFVVRFNDRLEVEETAWCLKKGDWRVAIYYFFLPLFLMIVIAFVLDLLVKLGLPSSIAQYLFCLYLFYFLFSIVYMTEFYKEYYLVKLRITGDKKLVASFMRDFVRIVKRKNFYPPRKIVEKVKRMFGVDLSTEYSKFLSLLSEARGD